MSALDVTALRAAARRVPPGALRGGAGRARGGEGDVRAGGDRRAVRRPLHPRAARRARARPRRPPTAPTRSRSPGCASPARRGSSPPSSPSARTRSRTRCSPRAWRGTARSCRSARHRRGSPSSPSTRDRDALGAAVLDVSAGFNDERRALLDRSQRARGRGDGDRRAGRPQRGRRRASRSARSWTRSTGRGSRARPRSRRSASAGSTACSARNARRRPRSAHMAWIRRLSPLEATYTKERSVPVCLETLHALGFDLDAEKGIRPDLEDRPQKSPRACVIASDPPRVVHLITRAQGGLHDYEAFLHEAGHALHYAGCDAVAAARVPSALARPRAHRDLLVPPRLDLAASRAGTPSTSGSRTRRRSQNADAARFSNTLLFRRYSAKLGFELDFWTRFPADGGTPDGYEERLTAATGIRYPAANHLADMDAGFYSADYLRAWIRSAQLRAYLRREVGEDWWRQRGDRSAPARSLPRGHAADDRGGRRAHRLRRRSTPHRSSPS